MRIVQRRSAVLAAAVVSVCGSAAFSQTSGDWIKQSGSWSLPENWQGGVIADGAGATADFSKVDLTAAATLTLDGNRTVGTATFGDANITTPFGWVVNSGTPTGSTLTLAGASGTSGTLNIGYVSGQTTLGLGDGQTVTINAPVIAPNGLNVNLGQFGTGIIGRRNVLALGNVGTQIGGTLRLNGIGDVNYSGGATGLAGVTDVQMTNPFTVIGGTQGLANRQMRLRLAGGEYNFTSTLTGGAVNADARVGISSYSLTPTVGTADTIINGNSTLLGGTGAVFEAQQGSSLTINGNVNGTAQSMPVGSALTLRGVGVVTINGDIALNKASRSTLIKTDNNTVVVNGTIDAYALSPVGGGTFRLRSFGDVSADTRILGGAPSLESSGALTRSLGSGPGQIASAGSMNLGATAGNLTINFGGQAAGVLFGDIITVTPADTTANEATVYLYNFDAGTNGFVPGMFATGGSIPGNTFVSSVNGTLVTLDQAPTATASAVALSFSRADRINGALNLNSSTAAGNVTVLNPLDLNAPSTGTTAAPTVRVVNSNKNTVTLEGAVTNSGPGVGTFAKGGAGHLVIAAPITLLNGGNFRHLGGTFEINPGIAVAVNAVEVSGGSIDAASLVAANAINSTVAGTFINGGTINLPTSTGGTFDFTFGGPLPGFATDNIIFSNPDGSRGANSGFNNVGTSPVAITFNGGAVLERDVTPGFDITGFRTASNHSASLTITNDIILDTVLELSNESTSTAAELTMSGSLSGSNGAIRKRGVGVVRLSGNNTYSQQTLLAEGTLAIASPNALGNADGGNEIDVAFLANTTLRFDASMTVGAGKTMVFGTAGSTGLNGTFNTNGNNVTLTGTGFLASQGTAKRTIKDGAGTLTIAFVPTAPATEVLNAVQQLSVFNGTLAIAPGNRLTADAGADLAQRIVVGDGAGNNGVLQVDGGTVTTNGYVNVGRGTSNGTVIVNSGLIDVPSQQFMLGHQSTAANQATLTINGGTVSAVLVRHSDGLAKGTINLNGGSLITTRIAKETAASIATFNANGGTLSPRNDPGRASLLPTFMQGLNNAHILEGGLKIDTLGRSTQGGFTMTINQSFTHGGTAAVDGGITKLGAGNVILGGTNTYTGPTSVQVGTLTASAPRAFGKGQLQVASAAIADTAASLATPLVIGDISIAAGGTVKLNNNKLVIDYTGVAPLANVRDAILPFFGTGTYDGTTGLTTNPVPAAGRGLGYADTSTMSGPLPAAYASTADATSILVQVTLRGDANIDGNVAFADLVLLAQSYNQGGKFWQNGDFNYDGTVNFADLVALAGNYNQSLTPAGSVVATGNASAFSADWALAQSLVPEPTALAGLALLGGTLGRRRRAAAH